MTRPRRTARAAVSALASAVLTMLLAVAVPSAVHAHGIIDLGGTPAVAGGSSTMTLEIQHGCITTSSGTVQVQAFVGKPWGRVVPQPVAGWTVRSQRLSSGGRQLTWTKQGDPQPFGTPVFFPIRVAWPAQPGVYNVKVVQACPDDITTWGTPAGPATAGAPSPPLTPIPQVKVLPAD